MVYDTTELATFNKSGHMIPFFATEESKHIQWLLIVCSACEYIK